MKYLRVAQISQVKTSSMVESNALFLFKRFKLMSILRHCKIGKGKGHPIEYMLYLMLIILLQRSRSLFSGLDTNPQTATISKKIKLYDNQSAFTLHGWIRTRDTVSANITIRCFSSRSSGYPVSTESITADISGNTDWQSFYKEFSLPSNAWYFDIRLSFTGSGSSRSKAFFDNVGLIQWEEWMPHDQNLIVHPNDFYWFQLRSSEGVKSITCQITETSLTPTRDTQRKAGKPPALPVVIYPNPFKEQTNISFEASTKNPGLVKIYNIKGQLVRRLHDESGGYGPRKISWDSKDSNGNSVASGLYFFRIESGDRVSIRKAILLK